MRSSQVYTTPKHTQTSNTDCAIFSSELYELWRYSHSSARELYIPKHSNYILQMKDILKWLQCPVEPQCKQCCNKKRDLFWNLHKRPIQEVKEKENHTVHSALPLSMQLKRSSVMICELSDGCMTSPCSSLTPIRCSLLYLSLHPQNCSCQFMS